MAGTSQPPGLSELGEESVLSAEGEVEGGPPVVVALEPEVLDDAGQQVSALHAAARGVVAEPGEVDVEVVVGGLVVQVDPQLGGRQLVALEDDFLKDSRALLWSLLQHDAALRSCCRCGGSPQRHRPSPVPSGGCSAAAGGAPRSGL